MRVTSARLAPSASSAEKMTPRSQTAAAAAEAMKETGFEQLQQQDAHTHASALPAQGVPLRNMLLQQGVGGSASVQRCRVGGRDCAGKLQSVVERVVTKASIGIGWNSTAPHTALAAP